MNIRRPDQFIIGAVALHSIILGAAMLFQPTRMLGLVGWEYEGSVFFPAQSGIFLLILGGAYVAAIWHQPFVWLLVASKATALVFLFAEYLAGNAPPIILLQAVLDGFMGIAVAGSVTWRARMTR